MNHTLSHNEEHPVLRKKWNFVHARFVVSRRTDCGVQVHAIDLSSLKLREVFRTDDFPTQDKTKVCLHTPSSPRTLALPGNGCFCIGSCVDSTQKKKKFLVLQSASSCCAFGSQP